MKYTEDYYARLAREKGYPARSVFKLMEMQEKFGVIKPGDTVLDVGAAPGGFSLFILEKTGRAGKVTGVDLSEISGKLKSFPADRFRFIRGDIFDTGIVDAIASHGPYSLIVSDAAPSTTGDRIVDTARSCDLARQVLLLAEKTLADGGRCIIKIFQSGDDGEISESMKKGFRSFRIFKPKASKKASMEIYFIGSGFLKQGVIE
jgi:23S rRNA (uridine2552-2'-O)-methyltransferase